MAKTINMFISSILFPLHSVTTSTIVKFITKKKKNLHPKEKKSTYNFLLHLLLVRLSGIDHKMFVGEREREDVLRN